MSEPKRRVLHQWGYRINETGIEWWGFFDSQYNGANSVTRKQAVEAAQNAVAAARAVGVEVTATLLRRDQLTTIWTRWVPGRERLETIQ